MTEQAAQSSTIARSKGQFWGAVLVCALLLVCGNAVVARLTRQTISRRILKDAASAGDASVIALGNSLVRSGFDAEEFSRAAANKQARLHALNMAMGASTPPEHLLLLRAALRSDSQARLLLYGFYDFQLTDPVTFTFSDLIGNHDLLYYDEPEFARQYYAMARYDSVGFAIARRIPLLYERGAVWAKVERVRRAMGQQGMPAQASNRFGRTADFTLLEAKNREDFEQRCDRGMDEPLNAPVKEIIREAQERRMRVVFMVMPLPPKHVETFYDSSAWKDYEGHLQQLLAQRNVTLLDASRWIADSSKFADALHLKDEGAAEFSRRLGALCGNSHEANPCME